MVNQSTLTDLLQAALHHGGDFAEIFLENTLFTHIFLEAKRIEKIESGRLVGAGIRVLKGEATSFAYTNDLSEDGLFAASRRVAAAVKGAGRDTVIDLRREEWKAFPVEQRPDEVDLGKKVTVVELADTTARALDPRIKQVRSGYRDIIQKITVANSEGGLAEDERIRTSLTVEVVAEAGGIIQTGRETVAGIKGFEIFNGRGAVHVARTAGTRALLMLDADRAPAGCMTVILAGESGGTMIHEACGHGLEADLVQKGMSVYGGRVGELVASPLITVVDDATLEGKYGSFAYDDEGVPAQQTVLIEKGILKDYMYDRLSARRHNRVSTGNGRREGYNYLPIPRMTNTFVQPGDSDPQEIVNSTDKGILVRRMGGGQVNTTNGDFVFQVQEGYLVEKGKVTRPVRGATITGNGPEALRRVDMVGNDLHFDVGICGKGQLACVADGQPTLRIPELVVGGVLQ